MNQNTHFFTPPAFVQSRCNLQRTITTVSKPPASCSAIATALATSTQSAAGLLNPEQTCCRVQHKNYPMSKLAKSCGTLANKQTDILQLAGGLHHSKIHVSFLLI